MKKVLQGFTDVAITPSFEATVPSKLMLIGEYSVLVGGGALVTTLAPRFAIRMFRERSPWATSVVHCFHSESSVARFIADFSRSDHECHGNVLDFSDPHSGRGGFGGSTAEFILAFAALRGKGDLQSVWREYRKLNPRASGADLAAQYVGGTIRFSNENDAANVISFGGSVGACAVLDRIQVFSATHQEGRKLNTTLHLESETASAFSGTPQSMREPLYRSFEKACSAFSVGDARGFGAELSVYADVLSWLGLEVRPSHDDRIAFCELSGVYGAKGVGAGLSDVMIVVTDGHVDTRNRVSSLARMRNLVELDLSSGLGNEPGLEISTNGSRSR